GIGNAADDNFAALTVEFRNDPHDSRTVVAAKAVLAVIECGDERTTGYWVDSPSPTVNLEVGRSSQELVLAIIRDDTTLFLLNDRRPRASVEEREIWDAGER